MLAHQTVLAVVLAVTGGCPTVCPHADPVNLTDDPGDLGGLDPEISTGESPELPEVRDVEGPGDAPVPELDLPGLIEELTGTSLPGEGRSLPMAGSQASSPAVEDPLAQLDPETAGEEPGESPSLTDEHVPRTEAGGPQAQGESAHARPAWPQTNGERVQDAGASLFASLLLGLAAIGLHHKLSKDRALEHPARQRILSMLEEETVLGTTDVADEIDACYRTARHHLEVLERFDLVFRAERRGNLVWARPEDAEEIETGQVTEIQRRMVDLLEETPGLHLSEIARRLDAPKATVKNHLEELNEREEIEDQRTGPLRRFFPVDNRGSRSGGA